jgi:ABC-2 type transport system permease protein
MNQTEFKPNHIQKLLGRHYKWWYIAKHYFKLEGVYFISNLFHFVGQSISIFTAIIIWLSVAASQEITTNLLVGLILFTITGNTVYWIIGYMIEQGTVTRFLIVPTDFMNIIFTISAGFLGRIIVYNFFIFAPAILFLSTKVVGPSSYQSLFLIFILACIGFSIRFLCAFVIGVSTFWTTQVYGQGNTYENLLPLLIGLIFPYDLIAWYWLRDLLVFSPWSMIVHHPMQIYLGKYNTNQTILVFVGGMAWCIVLYFFAKLIFNLGLKRNEAVGL